MVWPLEESVVKEFAKGLSTIMVVEEKRSLIEAQLRDILYAEPNRPAVIGKKDVVLLGIYSHMIHSFLYLPDYPIGHLIAHHDERA